MRSLMKLTVALIPSAGEPAADVAVVIDVLRATTVMATAINAGASRIVTCREVDEARQQKSELGETALLCGERQCQRIEGFDLGNSPSEYSPDIVRGRTVILTTTNGTRAIDAAQNSARIVTASFLNLSAVVDAIAEARDVRLICAGTDGNETGEDVLLAGAIAQGCFNRYNATLSGDGAAKALMMWQSFRTSSQSLVENLRETAGGQNLVRYGFQSDLSRCAASDSIFVVPEQISSPPTTFVKSIASE